MAVFFATGQQFVYILRPHFQKSLDKQIIGISFRCFNCAFFDKKCIEGTADGCPLSEAAKWWYHVTAMKLHITDVHYTPIQLKMPLEIERIIEVNDPVYTFHEVMSHIDLNKYSASEESRTGRPKYDCIKLMKVILFAFMEHGYISAREIQKLCKTDIRFLWLLDGTPAPSHMTIANFIKTAFVKDNFIH